MSKMQHKFESLPTNQDRLPGKHAAGIASLLLYMSRAAARHLNLRLLSCQEVVKRNAAHKVRLIVVVNVERIFCGGGGQRFWLGTQYDQILIVRNFGNLQPETLIPQVLGLRVSG